MPTDPGFSPEAIAEALREATPGPWWAGADALDGDHYWDSAFVYALDTVPPPFEDLPYGPAGERRCAEVSAWEDEHSNGVVAETHNYTPIPDEQHDANQRLIANAPTWLAQLLAALEAERVAHARRVGELDRCNERVLEVLAVLEYERNEFDKALATAEAALEAVEKERDDMRLALSRGWTLTQYEYARDHDLWAAHAGDGTADDNT